MDVKTLREVHKKERMSPYLQEVGKGFYTELGEYLQGLYARYMESSREGDISRLAVLLAELENAKALATEIYETRERKIVNSALAKAGGKVEVQNLTAEEEEALRGIVTILRGQREAFLGGIVAEHPLKPAPRERQEVLVPGPEPKVEERPSAAPRLPVVRVMTVRVLKDLPSIVGLDGKVYGSFKEQDVVTLPEANALVFVNQGVAELIEMEV